MATAEEIKNQVTCHDVAEKLGLEKPKGGQNYRSPHHADSSPSLSVFDRGRGFKDWSCDGEEGAQGSCIDLAMWVKSCTFREALDWIHDEFGFEREPVSAPRRPATREESVAARAVSRAEEALPYLIEERGIPDSVCRAAIQHGALGFDDWTNPKRPEGEIGHGGPAAAFVVRSGNPGRVRAIDLRFVDPSTNGGLKTKTMGDKVGLPWTSDWRAVERAHNVYLVESAINALSVEACGMKSTAAVATRGLKVDETDWRFLAGKKVLLAMDADGTNERGRRPGPEAAWRLYELLTSQNIAAFLVDQAQWIEEELNDVNDVLREHGADELRMWLNRLDRAVIPGLPTQHQGEKARIFLPSYDYAVYWRYRAQEDYTSYVAKFDDGEDGQRREEFAPVCGFRVAGLTRIQIQSATATTSGAEDAQPSVQFAVSVQVARHGNHLVRRVFSDEELHNQGRWAKFGPIYDPKSFARMVSIIERTADLGSRTAANFVGLCWLKGRLHVNEGADCYFVEPEKQCPYHTLTFPRGPRGHAGRVLRAYQETFKDNAATLPLVWILGAHLKAILGFWPHMQMQARKASGKSTLVKRLERATAFKMFSGQALQTEYRLVTSISHTSHPVGWEEISARRQDIIDRATSLLQEAYGFEAHRRGSDHVEFLNSAPVMLVGEDVPVRTLTGKLVRTDLSGRKGPMLPLDLPKFPMRAWLDYLAGLDPRQVHERMEQARTLCLGCSRATGADDGASRMAENYAALFLAWELLCDFAGLDVDQGDFRDDLVEQMNGHIGETSQDREPWVWILEILLSELAAARFMHPYTWDDVEDEHGRRHFCLILRTSHVMDHLQHSHHLRDRWNAIPIKSDRVFKQQCRDAGMLVTEDIERRVNGKRLAHAVAFSVERLEAYGLSVPTPEDSYGPPPASADLYDDHPTH